MFNPKHRILITSKYFPEDNLIGLGSQLISILSSVKNYLPPHIWYVADVEAVGRNTASNFSGFVPRILLSAVQSRLKNEGTWTSFLVSRDVKRFQGRQ